MSSPLPERRVRARAAAVASCLLTVLAACDAPEVPTAAEMAELEAMELAAGVLPASPTNRLADDAAAAALGRTLFFDRGLCSDGTVACADCHDPALRSDREGGRTPPRRPRGGGRRRGARPRPG